MLVRMRWELHYSRGRAPTKDPSNMQADYSNPQKKNYSTTEREALAVVWSVQKFRGYLEEARWALQLQPYNFRIEYTPGKANVVADTLSRPFLTEEPPLCHISLIHTELPRRGAAEIRQGQLNDPDLKKIIDAYEHGTREETERWTARGYLLTHGVLYRYSAGDDNEEDQSTPVIPIRRRGQPRKVPPTTTTLGTSVETPKSSEGGDCNAPFGTTALRSTAVAP
jgi:hypothetical protein